MTQNISSCFCRQSVFHAVIFSPCFHVWNMLRLKSIVLLLIGLTENFHSMNFLLAKQLVRFDQLQKSEAHSFTEVQPRYHLLKSERQKKVSWRHNQCWGKKNKRDNMGSCLKWLKQFKKNLQIPKNKPMWHYLHLSDCFVVLRELTGLLDGVDHPRELTGERMFYEDRTPQRCVCRVIMRSHAEHAKSQQIVLILNEPTFGNLVNCAKLIKTCEKWFKCAKYVKIGDDAVKISAHENV